MLTEVIKLSQKRVCVKVERKKNKLVVMQGIYELPPGTLLCSLYENDKVVDPEGNELKATGRYYITAETINPYHLLVDLFY